MILCFSNIVASLIMHTQLYSLQEKREENASVPAWETETKEEAPQAHTHLNSHNEG